MAIYDPNSQPEWTPPAPQPGYTSVPADAQPMTGGDRWALVALAIGIMVPVACIPILNCFAPHVALIMGVVVLNKAKTATDPSRARLYGWIATGVGALFLILAVVGIAAYGAIIAQVLNNPQFRNLPR